MSFKVFHDLDYLNETDLNDYLMKQTVMQFATAAARDTALTAPVEGMTAHLADQDVLTVYTGTAWIPIRYTYQVMRGRTSITTDASGNATITHGAGYIPSIAFVMPELATTPVLLYPYNKPAWTTTTFQVRAWTTSSGAFFTGTMSSVEWMVMA